MNEKEYDVFISYSSKDQKIAEGICAYLEQRKIRCFVAYRDIPRGVVWARAIVDALDESRMMVVVFSKNFNISEQVDREIELAAEDHKPILTFRLSDDAFVGAKKYYLKNINWIDAFPNPDACFGDLARGIGRLLDISVEERIKIEQENKRNAEVQKVFGEDLYIDQSCKRIFMKDADDECSFHNLIIKSDMKCVFYIDGERKALLDTDELEKVPLVRGVYEFRFVSLENKNNTLEMGFYMADSDEQLKVSFSEGIIDRFQWEKERLDVFISYSRYNEEQAKNLYDVLKEIGLNVWCVRQNTADRDTFRQITRDAIERTKIFVALISESIKWRTEENGPFYRELAVAIERAKRMSNRRGFIIPVALDNIDIYNDREELHLTDELTRCNILRVSSEEDYLSVANEILKLVNNFNKWKWVNNLKQ